MRHKTQLFVCKYTAQKIEIRINYIEIEDVLEQYLNLENMLLVIVVGSTVLILFMYMSTVLRVS